MTAVPAPEETPEIKKAVRANDRWMKALFVLVAAVLVATIALVVFRFSDQARQSTTALAARRTLAVAERQNCRSEYISHRNGVLEAADAEARRSIEVTIGYLLGQNSTGDLAAAKGEAKAANDHVGKLQSLTDMVDNGFTADGTKYPACPVVK